ncbi:MAG: acyl carrier protein [Deltaproteobacteria bacterium]|nr:acyl carrier protein [Deltaproteobacteria bacterium]
MELEIKKLIVEALSLDDISPEQIDVNEPLFGEGLGLDSIDALEIAVALEEHFGIDVSDEDDIRSRFKDVASLANLVRQLKDEQG